MKQILLITLLLIIGCKPESKYSDLMKAYNSQHNEYGTQALKFFIDNIEYRDDISDVKFITEESLRHHIDCGIDVWKGNKYSSEQPWSDVFRYLLLYNKNINYITEDRAEIFNSDIQYLYSLDSSLTVFQVVDSIKQRYDFIAYADDFRGTNNINDFIVEAKANCGTMTRFNEALFSSLGFVVTTDYINEWANTSGNHAWNVLIHDNDIYPFDAFYEPEGWFYKSLYCNLTTDTLMGKKRISKVFRDIISGKNDGITMKESSERIPDFFKNKDLTDVSNLYFETTDITVDVPKAISDVFNYVWILTSNNNSFAAAYWAEIKGAKALFKGMGRDVLYFFAGYSDGRYYMFGDPLYCDLNGDTHKIKANKLETENVLLTRKYPYLNVSPVIQNSALKSIEIYGSNTASGTGKLLKVINDSITSLCDTLPIKTDVCYKHYRIVIPYYPLESNDRRVSLKDHRTVADIDFFIEENNQLITVKPRFDSAQYEMFDDNTLTYYSAVDLSPIIVSVSFDKPVKLHSINITPRNDKNYVYKGFEYELVMWDSTKWKSIETEKANANFIEFGNVPKGALLMLKCRTEGEEERVFMYENGVVSFK